MAHRSSNLPVLLVAAAVLVAGCSRVPPGGEVGAGGLGVAVGGSEDSTTGATGSTDGSLAVGEAGGGTPGAGGTSATGNAAARGGGAGRTAAGGAGSVVPGVSPAAVGQGVDPATKTVKVVFPMKVEQCGPDSGTASQDVATEKGRSVLKAYVDFFNKEVLGPINGWKITYSIVDDGGLYCPEKARAAAVAVTKEIKPFAVLGGYTTVGQGPVLQDAVTRAGIVHIGNSWGTFDEFRKRHPYAWDMFAVPQQLYTYLSWWMGKRVKGTPGADPTTGAAQERVYGIVTMDLPANRQLASFLKAELAQRGIDLKYQYFMATDPGVAAQSAATTVNKMRSDGVNSLVFDFNSTTNGGQAGLVLTNAMGGQNYLPDLLIPANGNAFFERFFDSRVWAKARGVSSFPAIALRVALRTNSNGQLEPDPMYTDVNENASAYQEVWQRAGNNDQAIDGAVPGAFDLWGALSLLAQGMMRFDGPLNVQTWSNAVALGAAGKPNHCGTERFMGRDYDYNIAFNWNPEHDGGLEGFTTIYWVNEQTSLGTNGYYESYDNYRYFKSEAALPAAPTHDTGDRPPDIPKQKPIGLKAWTSCTKFGMRD